jgi:hypothetical protein
MPKLYEYFGMVVFFYSNEHEPVHVHGRCQGRESRAELIIENGQVIRIIYASVSGRLPLDTARLRDFKKVVEHFSQEIVTRWVDYFVLHRPIQARRITRRIG